MPLSKNSPARGRILWRWWTFLLCCSVLAANACAVPEFQGDGSDRGSGGMGGDGSSVGGNSSGGNDPEGSGGNDPDGSGGLESSGGADGAGATGGTDGSGGADGSGGEGSGGEGSGGDEGSGGMGSGGEGSGGEGSGGAPQFTLTVTGVNTNGDNADCAPGATAANCPVFPQDNTSYGENVSPELEWPEGPPGTDSYAVVLVDLSNGFAHWAVWDIPPDTGELPPDLPAGGMLTTPVNANQASGIGGTEVYFGAGACGNVYEFRLYALDTAALEPDDASTPASVIEAIDLLEPLAVTFVRMQTRDYCS